jgi:hypothetical protein
MAQGSHRAQRLCQLWLLPSYSPDYFKPIEEAFFSKEKNLLRKAKARRTLQALFAATAQALCAGLSPVGDARRGYFEHCGYTTPQDLSL